MLLSIGTGEELCILQFNIMIMVAREKEERGKAGGCVDDNLITLSSFFFHIGASFSYKNIF